MAPLASSLSEDFPRPNALAPQVAFWTEIYSRYSTSQAVIHDSERLDIIYTVVNLPPVEDEANAKLRQDISDQARERYVVALRHLAEAPPDSQPTDFEQTDIEQRVRALWGATDPQVLRAASERVRSQIGQADRFRAGIQRSGAYLPQMRAIMSELGLPEEILALPHVESSFNPEARSHSGATGIWQWMRSSGRHYLRIDRTVDERRDPLLSTRASGICLREYYEELGSWPLAITAYNHGLNGMRRARAQYGTDISAIVHNHRSGAFKFASRNFYTEFLAALDVSTNYRNYFGEIALDPELEIDRVEIARPVSLKRVADVAGLSPTKLASLNPALLPPITNGKRSIPAGYELRLPPGRGIKVAARFGPDGSESREVFLTSSSRAADPSPGTYRVERGDTLSMIARRYGTSVTALCQLNRLDSFVIVAGQEILVPASVR